MAATWQFPEDEHVDVRTDAEVAQAEHVERVDKAAHKAVAKSATKKAVPRSK